MQNDLISRSALIAYVKELPTYEPTDRGFIFKRYPSGVFAPDDIVKSIQYAPAVDAVDREKLIKKLFPMGVPLTREDWNYAINARAVYAAIIGDLVEPECKAINVSLDGPIEIHSYGERGPDDGKTE